MVTKGKLLPYVHNYASIAMEVVSSSIGRCISSQRKWDTFGTKTNDTLGLALLPGKIKHQGKEQAIDSRNI